MIDPGDTGQVDLQDMNGLMILMIIVAQIPSSRAVKHFFSNPN